MAPTTHSASRHFAGLIDSLGHLAKMRPRSNPEEALEVQRRTLGGTKKGIAEWDAMAQRRSGETTKGGAKLLRKSKAYAPHFEKQNAFAAARMILRATPDLQGGRILRDVQVFRALGLSARGREGGLRPHKNCNVGDNLEGEQGEEF